MDERTNARAELLRMMRWIVGIAAVAVVSAITYLALTGELTANLVVAASIGVFFSVVLGCGLFAVAWFSRKSGHDESASDATRSERERL